MDEKENKTVEQTNADTETTPDTATGADTETEAVKDSEAEDGSVAEIAETAAEAPVNGAPDRQRNKRLVNALIRAGAALVAAVLLLMATKFSVFDLMKGPTETDAAQHEDTGSFVKQDIYWILGDLSNQGLSENYMVAAIYDKIVVVHFTDRYLKSAEAVKSDTLQYVGGGISDIDKYVTVDGTVEKLSEDLSGKLNDWFAANKQWMLDDYVISDTGDDSYYLSDAVLNVDTVNSMNEVLVYAFSGAAALLLLYIIVELVLMASGFYLRERKPRKALAAGAGAEDGTEKVPDEDAETDEKASEETDGEALDASGDAGETGESEKSPENGDECIKDGLTPENNGSPEKAPEEKTENGGDQ